MEQGRASASDVFEASIIDARFQAEQWGEDTEALAAQDERRQEAVALGAWFDALGDPS